jgi:hypothetical protein
MASNFISRKFGVSAPHSSRSRTAVLHITLLLVALVVAMVGPSHAQDTLIKPDFGPRQADEGDFLSLHVQLLTERASRLAREMENITCVDEVAFRRYTKIASRLLGELAVTEGQVEKISDPDDGFLSGDIFVLRLASADLINALQGLKKCPPRDHLLHNRPQRANAYAGTTADVGSSPGGAGRGKGLQGMPEDRG